MEPAATSNPTIRLLLLGPSGAGKSTFINLLWFLSRKSSITSEKNSLISTMYLKGDESNIQKVGTEFQSRTIRPEKYTILNFCIEENSKAYDLEIIDTPGFLDTQGKGQDKKNLEEIRKFCCETKLNGVLVILNECSFSNEDYSSEYIMNMIKQIVGTSSDIKSIRFLVTNCANISNNLTTLFRKKFPDFEDFEFYNNYIFNEEWTVLEEKKVGKCEKYLKKELRPKCEKLISYFSCLSQTKLSGIKNLDSKIDLFREKIQKLYNELCDSLIKAINQSEVMRQKERIDIYFALFDSHGTRVCTNCTSCFHSCCSNCYHYNKTYNFCKVSSTKCNACNCNIIHHKQMNYLIVEDDEYKYYQNDRSCLKKSEFKKLCIERNELERNSVVSQKKDLHLNELKKIINDIFKINDQTNILSEWHTIKEGEKKLLGKNLDGLHLKAFEEIENFLLSYISKIAHSTKSFTEIEEMFGQLKKRILENGEYDKQAELYECLEKILNN